MTPSAPHRFRPPRGVEAVLRYLLRDDAQAKEVACDLEELARRRTPFLPSFYYWRQVAGLALRLWWSRASSDRHAVVDNMRCDLVQAIRSARRSLHASTTIVLTLGFAVGFTAAAFSVLRAIVLEPLPFPDADRLVVIDEIQTSTGAREDLSGLDILDFHRGATNLSALAGWRIGTVTRTSNDRPPESLDVVFGTGDLFEVLGTGAMLGRTLLPGDEGTRRIVVSEAYWSSVLNRDPGIVGSVLQVDGAPFEVVGVMPQAFMFPVPTISAWLPVDRTTLEREGRDYRTWNAIGRLSPGGTPQEAKAELDAIIRSVAVYSPENQGWESSVRNAGAVLREAGNLPFMLIGAVGAVLLIACVNTAIVLFARALERIPEVSVRRILGAGRARITRFIILESTVLAAVAGVVGIVTSFGLVGLLNRFDPGVLPSWNRIEVDWPVALVSMLAAGAAALVAGSVPASHVARMSVRSGPVSSKSRSTSGPRERVIHKALITVQVATTLVLLHGAGVLAWSLYSASQVEPGFNRSSVLTATAVLQGTGSDLLQQYEALVDGLYRIPGVASVGTVSSLPMNPVGADYHADVFSVEYPERTPVSDRPEVEIRVVSPGYLETLQIPLMGGRSLDTSDRDGKPVVLMVNETLAERFFPNGDAVGGHLAFRGRGDPLGQEIVGVVANVKHDGLDSEARPEVYLGFLQAPHNNITLAIRTLGEPADIVPAVRRAAAVVAPYMPLIGVNTLDEIVDGSLEGRRFGVVVFASMACLALVIALLGVYGVAAYRVSLRQREIGIRQAVGAESTDVFRDVVLDAVGPVALGACVGMVGALYTSSYLEAQVFGIEAKSPIALVAAALCLVFIGILGSWVPATRAARVAPIQALQVG